MCVLLMRVNLDYLDGFQCKHIEMKVQFILTGVRRVTIICDSIAKNISGIEGCRVQPFPGDTIAKLTNRLCNGGKEPKAVLNDFDVVIFHVGRNDIDNRASFKAIISDFGNLIAICRKENPGIRIIISAIIPRPKDHSITDPMIRDVNAYLSKKMSKSQNFKFICTYKPFTHCGKVKLELYAKRDLGLHLNSEGQNRLRQFFLRVISTLD